MIHYSLTLSLLKVFIAVCLFAVYRSQAAPLASSFSWLDDLQLPTAQLFCVDRKPDPANWTYKSLYRGDIAKYYIYEYKLLLIIFMVTPHPRSDQLQRCQMIFYRFQIGIRRGNNKTQNLVCSLQASLFSSKCFFLIAKLGLK